MNTNVRILICALLLTCFVYGQNTGDPRSTSEILATSNTSLDDFNSRLRAPGVDANINRYGDTNSKAIISSFESAKVSDNDRTVIVSVRYNEATNSFEMKNNDEIFNLNKIENLTINFIDSGKLYKVIAYVNDTGEKDKDFFMIDANNKHLLKKVYYKFIKGKVAKTSYSKDIPAKFDEKTVYYYKTAEGKLVDLSLSKKKLAKLFPEHSEKVLSFMKKYKINSKKEEDLAKLSNYLHKIELIKS